MSDQARITFEGEADVAVVRISGEIDLSNASDLEEAIVRTVANTVVGVVVDLSDLRYLDSAGVRMLAHLAERFRWRQQFFRATAPDGSRVRGVLTMAGAEQLIPLDATVDEARDRILESSAQAIQDQGPTGEGLDPPA